MNNGSEMPISVELSASYIPAINRVLRDIAAELNAETASPNTSQQQYSGAKPSTPIRVVHHKNELPMGESIAVMPVPILFDRSLNVWSQAAVLDWDIYKKSPAAYKISFPRTELLAGILIRYLEARKQNNTTGPAPYYFVLAGNSDSEAHSEEYEIHVDPCWPGRTNPTGVSQTVKSVDLADLECRLGPLYLKVLEDIDPICQRFMVLVPVYDTCPQGVALGMPICCLILNTSLTKYRPQTKAVTNDLREKYLTACFEVANRLVPRLQLRTNWLATEIQRTALLEASREQPRAYSDLLEHFIKMLAHVQTWKEVYVFKDGNYQYSYSWAAVENECVSRWSRGVSADIAGFFARAALVFAPYGLPGKYKHAGENVWSMAPLDLLTISELDALDEYDADAIRGCQLIFAFPDAAVLPQDRDHSRPFGVELVHQQLEVLRTILPTFQRRKAAVRNAVSAIMGRNASHNIGSHVLARLVGDGISLTGSVDGGDVDATLANRLLKEFVPGAIAGTHFLSYLQRRMDFIAELATSDIAYWSQPLPLERAIRVLDFDAQYADINAPDSRRSSENVERLPGDPVLVSYIAGKENRPANVKVALGSGAWFACPGGEVGVHALLVILENIIRNSARHGPDDNKDSWIRVHLRVGDVTTQDPSLLALEIIDCNSELGDVKELLADESRSQYSSQLVDGINSHLIAESILEANGAPNPQYWGLREMQVCAQYLRMRPLSMLEATATMAPPILEAGVGTRDDGKHCLKYTIYLKRPQRLALVAKAGDDDFAPSDTDESLGMSLQTIATPARPEDVWDWAKFVRERRLTGYDFIVVNADVAPWFGETLAYPRPADRTQWSTHALIKPAAETKKWVRAMRDGTEDFAAGSELFQAISDKYVGRRVPNGQLRVGGAWLNKKGSRNLDSLKPNSVLNLSVKMKSSDVLGRAGDIAFVSAWIDHADSPDHERAWLEAVGDPGDQSKPILVLAEGAFSESAHKWEQKAAGWQLSELLAAALPRVVVLDERVQSEHQTKYRGIALSKRWHGVGVAVPIKSDCDLDTPMLLLCEQFLQQQPRPDFLVIHLTILEALRKQVDGRTFEATLDWLRRTINGDASEVEVVIVTGRGVAKAASALGGGELASCRYLPLSALLEYLVVRPSKLALMRTLWAARNVQASPKKAGRVQ